MLHLSWLQCWPLIILLFSQIPAGCSWSGSRRHPRGIRGHGARWGAHRPHPALWYTPLPGPVTQPTLQTRRDQRAPHRAIAEGTQAGNISSDLLSLKHLTNWDQETVKQHKPVNSVINWEQNSVFQGNLYFQCFSFYSVPTLIFDDVWFFCCFGFFGASIFSSGHAYDCGHRVQCF